MSIEALLLADRDCLNQRSVGIRRAVDARLHQKIVEAEATLHFDALSLAVSSKIPQQSLNLKHRGKDSLPFYVRFPYFFYELYPQVPLEQYDQLALSQHLYLSHGLMLDRLTDGKLLLEPQIAHWVNSIYQKFILILNGLFPTDSFFWAYFEKCQIENMQALIIERLHHTYRISEYSEQEKILVFSGKSAMAKAGLAALAYLSQQVISDKIILSCDAFHIGLQYMDNLQDWRSDYRDHMYTPLLTSVLFDHQLNDKAESSQRPNVNVIGTLIYKGNYAQTSLQSAIDYFQLALWAIKDVRCPDWQRQILVMIEKCKKRQDYLAETLSQMKEKRSRQTTIASLQPKAEPVFEVFHVQDLSSSQQISDAWADAFCRSAGLTLDVLRKDNDFVGNLAYDTESLLIENAQKVLKCCAGFVAPPSGLQLFLCNAKEVPASLCFEYDQKWQIVLNLAAFSGDANAQSQFFGEHLAYQYGQMSRLRHAPIPESFLDTMCIKGFGLVFVAKALPELERFSLLPQKTDWFERNKHYLWQEVLAYLGSDLSFDLAAAMYFDNLDFLLSYDLIGSYCDRMGDEALQHGIMADSEDILNKSTALAIANCVAGTTNVSFDL